MSFGLCEGRESLWAHHSGIVGTSQRAYSLSDFDKGRFNYSREKYWNQFSKS